MEPAKNPCGRDIGPARVWIPSGSHKGPGLAMARSIGDSIAATVGVVAKPVVT